jgi:hypothetical protein
MASTVTASIVVQFTKSASSDAALVVEVDGRETADGGLNGGKTSFMPGDTVHLLLYKTSDVILDGYLTSLGSLFPVSLVPIIIPVTEDISFAGETEAKVKYPIVSNFNYQWIGANNGPIVPVSETTLTIPPAPAGSYPVGVARVAYNTQALVFRLSHSDPGLAEYSIVAFFAGHTA